VAGREGGKVFSNELVKEKGITRLIISSEKGREEMISQEGFWQREESMRFGGACCPRKNKAKSGGVTSGKDSERAFLRVSNEKRRALPYDKKTGESGKRLTARGLSAPFIGKAREVIKKQNHWKRGFLKEGKVAQGGLGGDVSVKGREKKKSQAAGGLKRCDSSYKNHVGEPS